MLSIDTKERSISVHLSSQASRRSTATSLYTQSSICFNWPRIKGVKWMEWSHLHICQRVGPADWPGAHNDARICKSYIWKWEGWNEWRAFVKARRSPASLRSWTNQLYRNINLLEVSEGFTEPPDECHINRVCGVKEHLLGLYIGKNE